ncbi:putative UPF0481 protein At3g02645 [Macadamia integrifolia]|uniref:putative UPF0481 protein At3g02645 n=1 Tax=Macadamia integrifolia TaxID=60698 RepID=UPI001C4F731D|nr:putative UPF0481 protein At3g02645 [Macadamia integrifolia]
MEKGILTIPTIMIDYNKELILRNLISFEQGQNYCTKYFTAYAYFLSGLIDTPSDVKLLERKGIITNHLCNAEDIVTLFGNIGKYVALDARYPYFYGVIKDLEEYHNKSWNKSKASLMQNYFNTPWASISVGDSCSFTPHLDHFTDYLFHLTSQTLNKSMNLFSIY